MMGSYLFKRLEPKILVLRPMPSALAWIQVGGHKLDLISKSRLPVLFVCEG